MRRFLRALLVIAGVAAAVPVVRILAARLGNFGARPDEVRRPLPGDECIGRVEHRTTNAISIAAPPEAVWPWLAQMGVNRAGWYSHDVFDNYARHSTERIHPEWQDIAKGDVLRDVPPNVGYPVLEVDPPHTLVLGGTVDVDTGEPAHNRDARGWSVWSFYIEPEGGGSRLLVRVEAEQGDRRPWYSPLRLFWDFARPIMQHRQLHELKRRAEAHAGERITYVSI